MRKCLLFSVMRFHMTIVSGGLIYHPRGLFGVQIVLMCDVSGYGGEIVFCLASVTFSKFPCVFFFLPEAATTIVSHVSSPGGCKLIM